MFAKNEIRTINKKKRAAMDSKTSEKKSRLIAEIFLKSEIYKNSKEIMIYMPLGKEVNTEHIKNSVFSDKKKLILPVTDLKTGIIIPRYVTESTLFKKGKFSVLEPCGTEDADIKKIDVVLVPGIAFDKNGTRVGFGKGCYDKFLKGVSAAKIGICYDFQICEKIFDEEHDVKMDCLISENGMYTCS